MRMKAEIVPGFFTLANMFCGFYASIIAATADGAANADGRFVTAAWLIIAAGVLDVLDGKLARMTSSSSDFGVQYDSLADVISFGIAPSMLSYFIFFRQWGTVGLLISFVPVMFGAIRLARFNARLKGHNKSFFEGLPIPAAALTIATFVIFNYELWGNLHLRKLFLPLLLIASLLMVTNIRYESMPNFSLQSSRANRLKILAVLIGSVVVIFYPQQTFFPLALAYMLSGVGRLVWVIVTPKADEESSPKKESKS